MRHELVEEDDPVALGERILAVAGDPAAWDRRALEGRRWVEAQFDARTLAAQTADVYRLAIERHAARGLPARPDRGRLAPRAAAAAEAGR
jgi:hypothetical protein